jgi:hypothetical protein
MNSLRFSPADLEANREGRLTDAQRKRLDADMELMHRQGRSIALGFAGLCVFNVVMNASTAYDKVGQDVSKLFSGESLTTLLNSLALVIAIPCLVLLGYRLVIKAFAQGTIRSIEGKVYIINRNSFRTPSFYKVQIWHGLLWTTFYFEDAGSLTYFQSGQRYRVYYLSSYVWRQALSTEEIPDEKAKR